MRNEFIETANVTKFNQVCAEVEDSTSLVGPSLVMITGPAGRGKTGSDATRKNCRRFCFGGA